MTFSDLLINNNLTVYKLSKDSGVPKTTIFDISSGKTNILDCSGRNLLKLSKCLGVSIEDLLNLDQELYNPAYDKNIPAFLAESIDNIKKAKKKKSSLLDCYLDETNSSINVCEIENLISKEQADYLETSYEDACRGNRCIQSSWPFKPASRLFFFVHHFLGCDIHNSLKYATLYEKHDGGRKTIKKIIRKIKSLWLK
jgi:plasmid maintenance system antidote protein VapI